MPGAARGFEGYRGLERPDTIFSETSPSRTMLSAAGAPEHPLPAARPRCALRLALIAARPLFCWSSRKWAASIRLRPLHHCPAKSATLAGLLDRTPDHDPQAFRTVPIVRKLCELSLFPAVFACIPDRGPTTPNRSELNLTRCPFVPENRAEFLGIHRKLPRTERHPESPVLLFTGGSAAGAY
jgi:hypothetical protein